MISSASTSAEFDVRQKNTLNFLTRIENDLAEADRTYKAIVGEIDEYAALKAYTVKELDFACHQNGDSAERKVLMDFGKQVYSRATIKPDAKLMVRVQADLFLQMPFDRVLRFVTKRLEFLAKMAEDCLDEIGRIKAHMVLVKAVLSPN